MYEITRCSCYQNFKIEQHLTTTKNIIKVSLLHDLIIIIIILLFSQCTLKKKKKQQQHKKVERGTTTTTNTTLNNATLARTLATPTVIHLDIHKAGANMSASAA